MDITRALDALKAHAERKANSAYKGGKGLSYLNRSAGKRRAVSEFNIEKYATRYFADEGDKAANPDDMLKLAHYALLEWQAATQTVGDVKADKEIAGGETIEEYERRRKKLISDRTKAGLEAARANGRIGGRPIGLSEDAQQKAAAAEAMYREARLSVQEMANALGIGKATLYRYLRYRNVPIGPFGEMTDEQCLAIIESEAAKAEAVGAPKHIDPDPQHTIHGTCIIDMGRTVRIRCEIDGKPATLEARITGRHWKHEDRIDGLPVSVCGYNLRYDACQRMWMLDDCMIAGVDIEPQMSDDHA